MTSGTGVAVGVNDSIAVVGHFTDLGRLRQRGDDLHLRQREQRLRGEAQRGRVHGLGQRLRRPHLAAHGHLPAGGRGGRGQERQRRGRRLLPGEHLVRRRPHASGPGWLRGLRRLRARARRVGQLHVEPAGPRGLGGLRSTEGRGRRRIGQRGGHGRQHHPHRQHDQLRRDPGPDGDAHADDGGPHRRRQIRPGRASRSGGWPSAATTPRRPIRATRATPWPPTRPATSSSPSRSSGACSSRR